MTKKLEPQNYLNAFRSVFKPEQDNNDQISSFGHSQERLEDRYNKERKAGRTLRIRARKPIRTQVINVRVEPIIKNLCVALAEKLEGSQADIIHEAIKRMAEQEGILEGILDGQQ